MFPEQAVPISSKQSFSEVLSSRWQTQAPGNRQFSSPPCVSFLLRNLSDAENVRLSTSGKEGLRALAGQYGPQWVGGSREPGPGP